MRQPSPPRAQNSKSLCLATLTEQKETDDVAKKDSQRIIEIREKANKERLEKQRREKRTTLFIQLGVALGIFIIVGAIVAVVVLGNSNKQLNAGPAAIGSISLLGTENVPLLVGDTAVTLGSDDAPVTIDLYEDYSCPHCADYEVAVGATMLALVAKGDAVVNYHPIRIVTDYGVAAGSASTCVAAKDSQNWPDFHTALYANHSQGSDGWRASDFANFAKVKGITDEAALDCIKKGVYEDWIMSNTSASRDAGVSGTPTLFINGKMQPELLDASGLVAAVDALKNN